MKCLRGRLKRWRKMMTQKWGTDKGHESDKEAGQKSDRLETSCGHTWQLVE
jgi:hypothetical protein